MEFWEAFKARDMETTAEAFEKFGKAEQITVLEALFQRGGAAERPHSASVLFRELHEEKEVEDFYEAWFPPEEDCREGLEGGAVYQSDFPAPIRVINGVNMENPREIVSVGLHWIKDDKAEELFEVAMGPKYSKERAPHRRGCGENSSGSLQGLPRRQSRDTVLR